MTIFIGADHRGFELKNLIIDYLQDKNIRVEDMGNYEYVKEDDYVDYAKKVAEAVLQNPQEFLGIVICGSGVGVSIAANRYHSIRCALGFNEEQVIHARKNDHINMLALAADYFEFEEAKTIIDGFMNTSIIREQKYIRRVNKLDE